ncbi:MAG: 50S ribosomal protein L17 [Candidatus Krumholzibacteriota bacterium]|nr:50S ribosomal protein L17 [Candidatus Krumholzibacteriota bacterium]
MRHRQDHRKLNRTASHRKAMLSNMVTSLFDKERITTTTAKAKEASRLAERMITFARRGDLAARRHVARTIRNPRVLQKLFDEIGPRFASRNGGYTRVLKLGVRRGDAAETALLELLSKDEKARGKKKKPMKTYHKVDVPEDPTIAAKKEKVKAEKKAAAEAKEAEEAAKAAEEAAAEEAGAEDGEPPAKDA